MENQLWKTRRIIMRRMIFMLSAVLMFSLLSSGSGYATTTITDIKFSPASPSALPFSQYIDVTFTYNTDEAGGVRIFPRPITNHALTPNYAASGSPIYTGSGSGNGSFTVTAGETMVDHVRFRVYTSDQSALLSEFFIPVTYQFHSNSTALTDIVFGIPSPGFLALNQHLNVYFNYSTTHNGGVRIFPRPITNNELTPGYAASGSPSYSGSGSGSGFFMITSGETVVDHVRFRVNNDNQSDLLFDFLVPVKYQIPIDFSTVPGAPLQSVSINGSVATVSWTPVATAEGYIFVYAPYGTLDYIESIDLGNRTAISMNLLWGNVGYYTAVLAYNKNGAGPYSNILYFVMP
jgi:hypothetical protein